MVDRFVQLIGILVVMNIIQVHCESNVDEINVTILDGAIAKRAVCLDGSAPGYHYAKGFGEGAKNWMVYLEGGGWCSSQADCLERAKTRLGSSKNYTTKLFGGILSQNHTNNPDFYNWNRVYVRYCDGGSFTGDVNKKNEVPRRGARIFKFVVKDLLAKGMKKSKNVMLVGNSAGGLATMYNCDRFRELVPSKTRVKCVSDSGFFFIGKIFTPTVPRKDWLYTNLNKFHNITRFMPTSCTSRMDPLLCLYPENLIEDIKTPLFILNSAFDALQLEMMIKVYPADKPNWKNCTVDFKVCTPSQFQLMRDFRNTMVKTLQDINDCPSRGMFINSCYVHDYLYETEKWISNEAKLDNKTVAKAIGDWYFDRSSVKLIDTKNVKSPLNCTFA